MVFDVENKRFNDFIVAPVSRAAVVMSYLIAATVISFAFNLIALAAGELYIVSGGGELLSPMKMLEAVGIVALSSVSASSIMFMAGSYLKTSSAFGTLSTLLGTLIGFLTGVYVPLGMMPDAIQKFVLFVPFTHSAALFRQIFCARPIDAVFAGVPAQFGDVRGMYEKENGIRLFWGSTEIMPWVMLAVLAGVAVLFLLLSALRLRRYKQV
jgi:multidrug/hemolysin transport system permease protein